MMRKICEATNWVLTVAIDTAIILYLALILLMTVNPSMSILVHITTNIGEWYSHLPIPHNVLVPDWAWGFSVLVVWNGIVIVRGVYLLDRLENLIRYIKTRKTKNPSSKLVEHNHNNQAQHCTNFN